MPTVENLNLGGSLPRILPIRIDSSLVITFQYLHMGLLAILNSDWSIEAIYFIVEKLYDLMSQTDYI